MGFNLNEKYNCVVLEFKGDVMGGPDAVALNDKLHELIDEGKMNIVVDLGGVKFMNSSGLGMLIGALTTVRKAGGDLRLARASEKIESLLIVTKLVTVFKNFKTLEEATNSFTE